MARQLILIVAPLQTIKGRTEYGHGCREKWRGVEICMASCSYLRIYDSVGFKNKQTIKIQKCNVPYLEKINEIKGVLTSQAFLHNTLPVQLTLFSVRTSKVGCTAYAACFSRALNSIDLLSEWQTQQMLTLSNAQCLSCPLLFALLWPLEEVSSLATWLWLTEKAYL